MIFSRLSSLLLVGVAFVLGAPVYGQQLSQAWAELLIDRPFKGKNLIEVGMMYQRQIHDANPWQAISVTPDYERSVNRYLDLIGNATLSYTRQNDTFNTLEITPSLGARLYFTPGKRVELRFMARGEYRYFYLQEEDRFQRSGRIRLRPELIIPINRPSYNLNKQWYAITDFEYFLVLDQQVSERYANKIRYRAGLGYRFNFNFRVEMLYMYQKSRNEIGTGFDNRDSILRLRMKWYIS